MKAWFVFIPDEWGEVVHADTRGKAKLKVMHEFDVEEFIYLGATRLPKLDDKPLTLQNLNESNFRFVDEDGSPLKEDDFMNMCRCDICKGEK